MGKESGIAWTDHTFNPWWGCEKVSAGCAQCYAESFDRRLGGGHWGPSGTRRFFEAKHWEQPRHWNRIAAQAGLRAKVFCASMADVFEDRPDVAPDRLRLWGLIMGTPHLDWLLLTKRPQNVARMVPWGCANPLFETELSITKPGEALPLEVIPWPRNVWIGTTVEDQRAADERIPILERLPAAVRFLSVEPQLGRVRFGSGRAIDWVICGGESGKQARPFDLNWAFDLQEHCNFYGIAFFMKQLGSNPLIDGKDYASIGKGDDPMGWPVGLRQRDFPSVRDA